MNSTRTSTTSIHDCLREHARTHPKSPAILAPRRASLGFEHLLEQVHRTRQRCNALGIGRSDRVAVVLPKGPEAAVAILSVASFATAVPLDPSASSAELERYLERIRPRAVLAPPDPEGGLGLAAARIGASLLRVDADPERAGCFDVSGDTTGHAAESGWNRATDTALILLTSGTTSVPKLVPCRVDAMLSGADFMQQLYGLGPSDRTLHLMPMFHGHGAKSTLLNPIVAGSGVVCLPDFTTEAFFHHLDAFLPTWFSASYTIHQAILRGCAEHRAIVERMSARSGSSWPASLSDRT